jgi:serine phosphatase RsbU (regulator of sigma subunit)
MNLIALPRFSYSRPASREAAASPGGRANDLPLASDIRIATKQSASFGAGGDFFEIFEHGDGRVSVVVADVCGNGAAAARVAARVRPFLHRSLARAEAPGRVLAALNDGLVREGLGDRFVTAVAARIDVCAGRVEVACAGHLGPFLRRASGRAVALGGAEGVPLGLVHGERYDEISVALEPADALVLVTDGITDPLGTAADPLGSEALLQCLETAIHEADEICDALLADGAPSRDDATVLVVQLPGIDIVPVAA